MSASDRVEATAHTLAREAAAIEERQWVRLTRRCNNHCLFCHDIDRHDGTLSTMDEVRAQVNEGRARGAKRLVLSGGEPTIHPRFVEIVALGRAAGYRWVQVISNGRMFAYDRLVADVTAAGLDEATLSIHGHTPELHDLLAGAPGAFAQALRGLGNLQRAGRVVSVDVVVCRPNVAHLADILRFLYARGVREFDLLHLVPFGRAFDEQRAALEYDELAAQPSLAEALALSRVPDVHLWTNRWPAALLEGAEHLIQDPHKILDEVRGMFPELQTFQETGRGPICRGERCRRCFVEPLCQSLTEGRERLLDGTFPVIALDAATVASMPAGKRAALERQRGARLRVRAADSGAAAAVLSQLPGDANAELELDVARLGKVPPRLVSRTRRVILRCREDLDEALGLPGVEIEVPVGRATAEVATSALDAAGERVILRASGRALLSEVAAADLTPAETAFLARRGRAEGIARCLAEGAVEPLAVLDANDLDAVGGLDLLAFAERWVRDGYRVRSLRCRDCAEASSCAGAHVNTVRAHGFGWMSPKRATGEA